jgi:CDP-diacylglycerol--glycerol-3-phosphate 3-phosphatidyltransferase
MAHSELWTPANALTAARILVGPVCIWLLIEDAESHAWLALLLMVAAELSDLLDGSIARWSSRVTKFGKILDPMADCLYRDSVFIAFFLNGWMPAWMLAIILWRDLAVSYLREIAELGAETLAARRSGKWKAVVQGAAQVTIVGLAAWAGPEAFAGYDGFVFTLLAVATAVTAYSLIDYAGGVFASNAVRQGFRLFSAANLISLGRVVLAPVILLLLAAGTREAVTFALVIACVAAVSDMADGYVARRRGVGSEIGRYVDGACDAIFNMAVFLGFLANPNPWLPASWFIAIAFAEVIVPYLGIFAKQSGRPVEIRLSARLKTTLHPIAQIVVIGAALGISDPSLSRLLIAAAMGTAVAASIVTMADHAVSTVLRGKQNFERPA